MAVVLRRRLCACLCACLCECLCECLCDCLHNEDYTLVHIQLQVVGCVCSPVTVSQGVKGVNSPFLVLQNDLGLESHGPCTLYTSVDGWGLFVSM